MQYNDLCAFIEYINIITKYDLYNCAILIIKEYDKEHISKAQRNNLVRILYDKVQAAFTIDDFILYLKKAKLFATSEISRDSNDYPVFYLEYPSSGYLSIDTDKSTYNNPVFISKARMIFAIVFKSFKDAKMFSDKYNLDHANKVKVHDGYDEVSLNTELSKYTSKYGDFYYI